MVTVACETCGSQHSLDEASVPPSGKVIKCPTCAEPITVMPPGAAAMGHRAAPPVTAGARKGATTGFAGGALGDVAAPKRTSPLAGARGHSRQTASALDGIQGTGAAMPTSGLAAASGDSADLLAPVGPADIVDLPAPKGAITPPAPRDDDSTDLPAPVGPTPTRGGLDLPVPVGPTPTRGGLDLPAPKGFFDDATDLPAPGTTPAGAGAAPPPDLPAPKGFFDDIPAPGGAGAGANAGAAPPPDLPAPKGFFDDISAPGGAGAAPAAQAGSGAAGELDLDDLDLDLEPSKQATMLGSPAVAPPSMPASPMLDLGDPTPGGDDKPFGLDDLALDGDGPATAPPAVPLELDGTVAPSIGVDGVDGMELATPTSAPAPTGVVTFSAPSSALASSSTATPLRLDDALPSAPTSDSMSLELAAEPKPAKGTVLGEDGSPRPVDVVARVAPGEAREAYADQKTPKRATRARKLFAATALFVMAAGAGGFYLFQTWQSSEETGKQVNEALVLAKRHINSDQWSQAAAVAQKVLAMESDHADALGLASQSYFAAAIDTGIGAKDLVARGEEHFKQINKAAATGVEVDKAKGLRAVTERNPKQAIKILRGVIKTTAGDPSAHLYLGWAQLQAGDSEGAATSFAVVTQKNPGRLSGLYGLGIAHLELGQIKQARDALLKVTEIDKSHIGAHVGIAQIAEVDRFNDRENRYLEILNRPDIGKKDPRAVSRAWSLAGDEALRAGRIDGARARYNKSLELDPDNVAAQIGDGKTSLAQGRYEAARERLKVALTTRPNHVGARVAYGEASLALDDFDGAFDNVEKAMKIAPKHWRAKYVYGQILEKYPDAEPGAAEDIYRVAMTLAGENEIEPTVALSRLLVRQNRGREALAVLQPIEAAAELDAPLAVTLGVAYLGSDDPARAETWFRKALERRPSDVEAQLQLGLALSAQDRSEESLAVLKIAYEANEDRGDVGVRLAMVYEKFGQNDAAEAVYGALLARPGASLNARARAGRFYARTGRTDKAVTLGESILGENDRNAAGHFLRAEGLFAAGDYAEAQQEYRNATFIDPQAQYYEGLGRAAEKQSLINEALVAYQESIGLDGTYVAPRIGRARIRVTRHEYSMALDELDAALELAPKHATLHFYVGECMYETDQDRAAAASYSKSLRLDPKNAYTHYRLGRVYYDLDKRRDAAGALRTATTLAQGSEAAWLADAYYLMGMAARTAGNRSLAKKGFRAFIDLAPEDARVRDAKKLLLRLEAGGR